MFTLTTAAEHANTSRATVWRWIRSGKLSATRTDAGEFRIDPAELERHLASVSANSVPNKPENERQQPRPFQRTASCYSERQHWKPRSLACGHCLRPSAARRTNKGYAEAW